MENLGENDYADDGQVCFADVSNRVTQPVATLIHSANQLHVLNIFFALS